MTPSRLPDYAPMLAAYHRAFECELRGMVGVLPLEEGDRVLDVACGDGAYSRWLSERVGPRGQVVGIDLSHDFLTLARKEASQGCEGSPARFARADLDRLPFPDDAFDLVWCAQSLYSLPDPVLALRRMLRLVRPGGVVAVLENDSLHHILLPWPVEIELAVRLAEWTAFREESTKPGKFYVARHLGQFFRSAGFAACSRRTWASNRQAPLDPVARTFLVHYLEDLRERATPHLEPEARQRFERLLDPGVEGYLLDGPDFSMTCLDHVVWGVKAGRRPARSGSDRASD